MVKLKNKSLIVSLLLTSLVVAILSLYFALAFGVFGPIEFMDKQTFLYGYEALFDKHYLDFDIAVGFSGKYPCYHLVINIVLVVIALALIIYTLVMVIRGFKGNGSVNIKETKKFLILSSVIAGVIGLLNAILMLTTTIDGLYWVAGFHTGSLLSAIALLVFALLFIVINVIIFKDYKKGSYLAFEDAGVEDSGLSTSSTDDLLASILGPSYAPNSKKEEAKIEVANEEQPVEKVEEVEEKRLIRKTKPVVKVNEKKIISEQDHAFAGDLNGKILHVQFRKEINRWEVKIEGSNKALKLLNSQKEATEYADGLVFGSTAKVKVHKVDGDVTYHEQIGKSVATGKTKVVRKK